MTIRFAAAKQEGDFLVYYAMGVEPWSRARCDEVLTMRDARKLARAREALGYRTKITEKTTGTELI